MPCHNFELLEFLYTVFFWLYPKLRNADGFLESRTPVGKVENAFEQSPAKCPNRRLENPAVQQFHFNEASIYGPLDLKPHEWNSQIQVSCLSLAEIMRNLITQNLVCHHHLIDVY